MSNCTDCLLDLTDACPRGSGRAIDDEICDNFISRETYQVNKNDSWQLGYQQGRADAIDEFAKTLINESQSAYWNFTDMVSSMAKKLKENSNV